jgi:cytochrome c-type biogenesis protein CcmE
MSSDAHEATDPVIHSIRRRRRAEEEESSTKSRLTLVVPLVMAAAAIVGLVLVGFESKGIYSKTVDDIVKQKSALVGRPLRAEGFLVHGTLTRGADGCDHRFVMARNGAELPVRYPRCVAPDRLKDIPDMDIELTVEGQLQPDGSIAATNVLTKCPSKYEQDQALARGQKAPHRVPGTPPSNTPF